MSLENRRDRLEAAVAVLVVVVAVVIAGIYVIARFLIDSVFRIF